MSYLTAEQVQQQYIEAMGPDLGKVFALLVNDCSWLHSKWTEFVTLFGSNPERVDLLNESAGAFFRIVQDSLWENVLLHLSRLTDPARSAGKNNLSLQHLPDLVSTSIRPMIDGLVQRCLAKCAFARDWRNRHIAHRDRALALGESATPLAAANRVAVSAALDSVAALLNGVETHYTGSEVCYKLSDPLKNAEFLLDVIRDGLKAQADRIKRFETGNLQPDDLKPDPSV